MMLLLASCSKPALEEETIGVADYEFTAYAPDKQTDSRTYVDAQMKLHWTKNDLITIFHGILEPLKFGFRGATGATSGTYYNVDGIFYAPDQSAPNNVAVYPYSADHILNEQTRAVTLTMPAEQTYVANSFGLDANTMIAITSEVNDLALYFKNVGTYLNVRLWGANQTVKSITITATDGEPLSGKAIVTPTYGGDPTCVMANVDVSPSVKLVCEEAVTVHTTKEAPVSFWIVLPPVTMKQGFTATVENAEGETQEFAINQSVTFVRNKYNTLTRELDITSEVTIPKNEIHYTATKQVTPYNTGVFGATYLATQSTYDSTTKKGILKFDGEVTTIGEDAFKYCDALTSVTIPNSVTTIGEYAFYSCDELTSVTIPHSVTTIGGSAFGYCRALTSITIPDSVTTIEAGAFECCSTLKEFNGKFASNDGRCLIVDGVLNSFAPAGLTSYTIPSNVTAIGDSAFRDCKALISITIPDSVTEIGEWAFTYCIALTSITIPDSVTTIGYSAFYNCDALTSVTIPNSVTTIESFTFGSCSSLTSIKLPEGVAIGDSAFKECNALTSVTISKNAQLGYLSFGFCDGLRTVELKDGWDCSQANTPFFNCKNLTKAILGKTSHGLNEDIFAGCCNLTSFEGECEYISADGRCLINDFGELYSFAPAGLESYDIPDGITAIMDYAFMYTFDYYATYGTCLKSITLPASVRSIGINAFGISYWSSHKCLSFRCKAVTPPGYFWTTDSCPLQGAEIYIPRESYDAYREAWGDDLNFIPYY